jgi:hypothetical protein
MNPVMWQEKDKPSKFSRIQDAGLNMSSPGRSAYNDQKKFKHSRPFQHRAVERFPFLWNIHKQHGRTVQVSEPVYHVNVGCPSGRSI